MPDQQIKVGDLVYQKKSGWSGVPMRVLEVIQVSTPSGKIIKALCKGARGWGVNGLLSERYKAYVNWYATANLTHTPNSAMEGKYVDAN